MKKKKIEIAGHILQYFTSILGVILFIYFIIDRWIPGKLVVVERPNESILNEIRASIKHANQLPKKDNINDFESTSLKKIFDASGGLSTCSSPFISWSYNELNLTAHNVKFFQEKGKKLSFIVSGTNQKIVVLNRVNVIVNKVEGSYKYQFPGKMHEFNSSGNENFGIKSCKIRLNPNERRYECEDLTEKMADSLGMNYYDAISQRDNFVFYLSSDPGYNYYLQIGFEWSPLNKLNETNISYTMEKKVYFPKYVPLTETVSKKVKNIILFTDDISAIHEINDLYGDKQVLIVFNGKTAENNILKNRLKKNVKLHIINQEIISDSFLVIDDKMVLVKRKYSDMDWAPEHLNYWIESSYMLPRSVECIENVEKISEIINGIYRIIK